MFETAILILLYNKEIKASSTINSLVNSEFQYPNAKVVIWNNGPVSLKSHNCTFIKKLGYEVVVEETLDNESLAVIYNKFLAMNPMSISDPWDNYKTKQLFTNMKM